MAKKKVARPTNKPHQHKDFFSLRRIRVASTSGHIVWIEANTPTSLPEPLWAEAYKLGAMEFNPALIRAAAAAAEQAAGHRSQAKPVKRELTLAQAAREAVELLVSEGTEAQLTKAGVPKLSAVRSVMAKKGHRSEGLTSDVIYGIFGELQNELASAAAPVETPVDVDESDLEDLDGTLEPVGGGVAALLAAAGAGEETEEIDE